MSLCDFIVYALEYINNNKQNRSPSLLDVPSGLITVFSRILRIRDCEKTGLFSPAGRDESESRGTSGRLFLGFRKRVTHTRKVSRRGECLHGGNLAKGQKNRARSGDKAE